MKHIKLFEEYINEALSTTQCLSFTPSLERRQKVYKNRYKPLTF